MIVNRILCVSLAPGIFPCATLGTGIYVKASSSRRP